MWRRPSRSRGRKSSRLKEKLRLPRWWDPTVLIFSENKTCTETSRKIFQFIKLRKFICHKLWVHMHVHVHVYSLLNSSIICEGSCLESGSEFRKRFYRETHSDVQEHRSTQWWKDQSGYSHQSRGSAHLSLTTTKPHLRRFLHKKSKIHISALLTQIIEMT